MPLRVNITQKARDAYVVAPSGQIDGHTYSILENAIDPLLAKKPPLIALDLAEVDYLSSAGIRIILKTKKTITANGGKLVFMHLQPQIKKVFEIIEALPAMRVFKDLHEMDAYLDQMQKQITGKMVDEG
jgi:anti-anti-sigma factor